MEATPYGYYVNLDERGEFYADVRNPDGASVFEIHGFEIFDDGFMKDKGDIAGLQEYLADLQVIGASDKVYSMSEFEELIDRRNGGDSPSPKG